MAFEYFFSQAYGRINGKEKRNYSTLLSGILSKYPDWDRNNYAWLWSTSVVHCWDSCGIIPLRSYWTYIISISVKWKTNYQTSPRQPVGVHRDITVDWSRFSESMQAQSMLTVQHKLSGDPRCPICRLMLIFMDVLFRVQSLAQAIRSRHQSTQHAQNRHSYPMLDAPPAPMSRSPCVHRSSMPFSWFRDRGHKRSGFGK